MSYHGVDILWSFAKDDQFDEGELKPELIDLLYVLPITTRDKVEDSGLLAIVDKWSKRRSDSCAQKAGELADKWRKCLRRIPLRPKSAQDDKPAVVVEQQQHETREERARRRSPRLHHLPIKEESHHQPEMELTEEEMREREELRAERRRRFEEKV